MAINRSQKTGDLNKPSCVLVTTSAERQTLGGPQTRGTDSWLDDTDKNFGPDLPLLFELHEIWSVDY